LIGPLVIGNAAPPGYCLILAALHTKLPLGVAVLVSFFLAFLFISMPIFFLMKYYQARKANGKVKASETPAVADETHEPMADVVETKDPESKIIQG
jgi:hypothetical protein